MIDNVHMNDGGYRYLAERVFLVLRQVKLLP